MKRTLEQFFHDLRTPIASIGVTVFGLKTLLTKVLLGYRLAVEHHLIDDPLSEDQLALLDKNLTNIKLSTEKLTSLVNEYISQNEIINDRP